MNLNPKISVIVPVYNVKEEYLQKCIESVLNQSYKNFELIIINDNATDASEELILSYKDERIKYLRNKTRGGQGKARNNGLKIANGKYIFFLDADDWIDGNSFNELVKKAEEHNCDILCFGVYTYDNQTSEMDIWMKNSDISIFPNENVYFSSRDSFILDNLFNISNACWGKLFKKDFLIRNNLFFVESLIFEDMEYFIRHLLKANKIIVVKDYFYYYRKSVENSTMSSADDRYLDAFKIQKLIEEILIENNLFEELKMNFYYQKLKFFEFGYGKIMPQFKEKFGNLIKEDLKIMKLTAMDIVELKNRKDKVLDEFLEKFHVIYN